VEDATVTLLEVVSAVAVVLGSAIVLWTVHVFERLDDRGEHAQVDRTRARDAQYRRAA
jgi:hypothetical protein